MDHNKLWKILQEMGIPSHPTCLLRNLHAGQEATVRTGHRTMDWFKTGKGVYQGCILSPCFFNLYAEYIMRNARLDEAQAGIKISGRNINNLRYADDTTLMAESEEELKTVLMKVKEESEKAGLKFNIQKMNIMASGPIMSWQIDVKKIETVTDFYIFLGSKITADGDCGYEIKRCFLFGRKAMTNLENILKSRDIALPTKAHIIKAMFFPVVMLEKTLERVPWTARRSNQSVLKGIIPEYSLEGLMLKFQYFGHLMQRADSLEKTLTLGKIEGRRRDDRGRDNWMASLTQWT